MISRMFCSFPALRARTLLISVFTAAGLAGCSGVMTSDLMGGDDIGSASKALQIPVTADAQRNFADASNASSNYRRVRWQSKQWPHLGEMGFSVLDLRDANGALYHPITLERIGDLVGSQSALAKNEEQFLAITREFASQTLCAGKPVAKATIPRLGQNGPLHFGNALVYCSGT